MKYGPIEYYSILKQKEEMIRTPRYLINFKKQLASCIYYLFGEGNGNPLQYSCLENPHGQRSLVDIVHGVAKNQT